jgi:Region found in RelA / SpoT proteins
LANKDNWLIMKSPEIRDSVQGIALAGRASATMYPSQMYSSGVTKMSDDAPRFSNRQINKSGLLLRDSNSWSKELDEAFDIVGAWRTLHTFPMNFIRISLQHRARQFDSDALVSQRLKRIPAIQLKLRRAEFHNMKLSTMQDIAGCRAVVNTVANVQHIIRQIALATSYTITSAVQSPMVIVVFT